MPVRRIQQPVVGRRQLKRGVDETLCQRRFIHVVGCVAPKLDAADIVVDGNDVPPVFVEDQVRSEHAVGGRRRTLFVAARAKLHMVAVDDRVVLDDGIDDRVVAVERRVRHAVHDHQRAAETMAGQPVHVIVAHHLVGVDDADAAGVVRAVAQKHVVLHEGTVAMAQRQRAARFEKEVASKRVAAGFVRDDLKLAVAPVEIVVLDHRERVGP